jgi:glutamate 5-kinase
VVKLGTAALTHDDGTLAEGRFHGFVESLAAARREGREVVVVTSGAIGVGAAALGLPAVPGAPAVRRSCAAVGQGRLMARYVDAFGRLGVTASQLLVDRADLVAKARSDAFHRTLITLLSLGAVPIVNENDALAPSAADHEGAAEGFADNDQLAALVAERIGAELLVLLTDVDGVFTADPRGRGAARFIPVLELDAESAAHGAAHRGRGGMRSKLAAARHAAERGCTAIVASGLVPDVLGRLLAGEPIGTLVPTRGMETAADADVPVQDARRRVAV